ncbi:HlyD family type I secretion periplasmic adaptor subunit [Thalassomonas actiniarum]|uniref:Membrane fusion protein (MFP) family protein n=1 Tax=Thalassomonas actiniarum TaxID=485447 RepID=A0AAF0C4H2_9GAMM|nr:HlyD family type I secretion periplasmic adaptor subunit [Thalassomonas actiniarum]WDE02307.1 HlyD family type I secretion periplasmic adaptor subunit [Thalassomonas actiniarum]
MLLTHLKTARQALKSQRDEPAKTTLSQREYEFQPGYLEIVERPPAPWTKRLAIGITCLLLAILTWSVIGRLDIHAQASGKLIVSSNSKVVQAAEPGEITTINVADGQHVKAGEVLINLNPVGVQAEIRELQEQLTFQQLESARLQALLSEQPLATFVPPETASLQQINTARAFLSSEWRDISTQLDNYASQLKVNEADRQARQNELNELEKLQSNARRRLEASKTLADVKQFALMELLQLESELLEVRRLSSEKQGEFDVLAGQVKSLENQRDNFTAKTRRENLEKLSQSQGTLAVLKQKLVQAREKYRQHNLTAPVDGVVQQLAVHTLGGVVQAAQQLMVIVPDEVPLEAEVMVLNKDVGFVYAGQSVEIKIDAFPYTRYGTIKGEVAHVSRDAVENEQLGLVFPAKVLINSSTILVEDKQVPLQAGMSINGEIRTGDRRVIDYLLSPIQQYQSEAMGER